MSSETPRGRPATGEGAPRWRLARFLRVTVARALLAAFRVDFSGWEHVPEGGAILAGNHASYLDPVLLWCATPRPTHFVAKMELWDVGWLGWLLDRLWAFPVRRATADREMIQTATSILERGELLGMFPEGTRKRDVSTDELGEAHGGVAFLALRAGVPVVPVGIVGTERALPPGAKLPRFPRVHIRIGAPVDPASFDGGRKERVEALTARLMERIAQVRDEARRESLDAR